MLNQLFDKIGAAITSLGAVIFVMLMVITGMIFFSHTLFTEVFPSNMHTWEKMLATWVMALGWELTVLITTCNTKHLNSRIPLIMAVASGVIVLFFIQAFDADAGILKITQRWFVGILAATLNYIYADLFYAKWQERNNTLQLPKKLIELESALVESQRKLIDAHATLDEAERTHNEVQSELKELRSFKKRIEADLTCPHCSKLQPSYGTLRAHQGHCSQNPKNLTP